MKAFCHQAFVTMLLVSLVASQGGRRRAYSDSYPKEEKFGSFPEARREPGKSPPAEVMDRLARLESKLDSLTNSVTQLASLVTPQISLGAKRGDFDRQRAGEVSAGGSEAAGWVVWVVLLHEGWLFMQHANVLLNPYLQRLDRDYGIALLRRRLYWVIASVLAAYWARETASMVLSYAHVSGGTQRLIAVSCLYHTAKCALVSLDAYNRFSPKMGIMSLLIDHWHLDSYVDVGISLQRILLQAFDTATHFAIVSDLCAAFPYLWTHVALLAAVWSLHSLVCQVTRKSTATLFVEASKYLLYNNHNASAAGRHDSKKKERKEKECDSQWSEASADLGEGGGGGGGGDEDVGVWLRDMSDVRESSKRGTLPIGEGELLRACYIAAGVGIAVTLLLWSLALVSGFVAYSVTSVMAASAVSAYESVRVKRGPQTGKVQVRYLLSRDKKTQVTSASWAQVSKRRD